VTVPATRSADSSRHLPAPRREDSAAARRTEPDTASGEVRQALDELKALTQRSDPTAARRALELVPGVLPRLTSRADSVEAEFRRAMALLILRDEEEGCRRFAAIEREAREHPRLRSAIVIYSRCQ
jgi:hypothetical protein